MEKSAKWNESKSSEDKTTGKIRKNREWFSVVKLIYTSNSSECLRNRRGRVGKGGGKEVSGQQ